MYSERTLRHFKDPKFAGEMKDADAVGEMGNPTCGDVMKIFLKIKDDKIQDISFQTFGCVAAIACTDVICELVKGKTIDEALKMKFDEVVKELGGLPPVKQHCSVLGLNALKEAIKNYRKK